MKAVDEPLFKSHKTGSGILADWVSGDIRVVSGKIVRYEHMGFLSVFENEDIYTLKNGKVMAHRHFDNKRVTNVNTELAILELEQHILNLHPEYRGTVGGTAEASDINAEGNLKKVKITIKTHPKGISKKSLTALIEEYMLKHPPFDVVYVRGEYESSKVFFRFDFDEKYRERRLKRLHTLQTLDKEHRETNDTED
ncbi:MAG: hypothetical protein Q4B68_01270 [Bacteroidales bacterium]|nr:hypothetical protein [Bacteroidales bacterium]